MDATDGEYAECAKNAVVLSLVIVIISSGFISRMRYWIYPIFMAAIGGM